MPQITVVVPAFRERENIPPLLQALEQALAGRRLGNHRRGRRRVRRHRGRTCASARSRTRACAVIHRIGRRGRASACLEGMLASSAPYVAVIDADLQHDETLLPRMLETLQRGDADIVVASRYMEGGSTGALPPSRVWVSRTAARAEPAALAAA